MLIAFIILLILAILYLFCLHGRTGHPGLKPLQGWHYAHRGLHDAQRPENSMAAFRAALDGGFGIELDVHLLADGNLAVMHDSSLLRTAGADITMEELTTEDLSRYRLGNTEETIPSFRQVLDLFDGKAPLIVELKSVNNNYTALTDAACRMLADYKGTYCVESFDPRCVLHLKKHYPHIVRGQLAENFFRSSSPIPGILKFLLTNHLGNFLTRPDFIAYKYDDRRNLGTFLARHVLGLQGVSWTIRSKEDFETAIHEGWIGIFEGFLP